MLVSHDRTTISGAVPPAIGAAFRELTRRRHSNPNRVVGEAIVAYVVQHADELTAEPSEVGV